MVLSLVLEPGTSEESNGGPMTASSVYSLGVNESGFNFSSDAVIKKSHDRKKERLNTKLLDAAKIGDHATCKRLVESEGAYVDAECRDSGATALVVATAWGHDQVVELLLKKGADPLVRDATGRSAVHVAAALGHLKILELFLEREGEILRRQTECSHEKGFKGKTEDGKEVVEEEEEKMIDARVGKRKMAAQVLQRVYVNMDSWIHEHKNLLPPDMPTLYEGSTLLHAASQWSRSDCVRVLILKGANTTLLDSRGLTALDVAGEMHLLANRNNKYSDESSTPPRGSRNDLSIPVPQSMALSMRKAQVSDDEDSVGSYSNRPTLRGKIDEGDEKADRDAEITTLTLDHITNALGISNFMEESENFTDRLHGFENNKPTNKKKFRETTKDVIQLLMKEGKKDRKMTASSKEELDNKGKGVDNEKEDGIRQRSEEKMKAASCLHTAVLAGNTELITFIMKNNKYITNILHLMDNEGLTPLHRAVVLRDLTSLSTMLAENTHCINIRDSQGRSLLYMAVSEEWEAGIDYLLNNGADVCTKANDHSTVLHVAAKLGNPRLMKELVTFENGIKVLDIVDKNHMSPLCYAVGGSSLPCVELLLKMNASPTIVQPGDTTLLHMAARYSSKEILELLIKHGAIILLEFYNSEKLGGMTPLHIASMYGRIDCVRVLLNVDADTSAKTLSKGSPTYGGTALHLAARHGHAEVVKLFLKYDRKLLEVQNSDLWYPLHIAARFGKSECTRHIIENGGNLGSHIIDSSGNKLTGIDMIMNFIPQPLQFMESIFDSFIEINEYPITHPKCVVNFKYDILMPLGNNRKQLNVLVSVINTTRTKLLEKVLLHPLVESFLFLKWKKLRIFFYIMFTLYSLFTLSLTGLTVSTYIVSNKSRTSNSSGMTRQIISGTLLSGIDCASSSEISSLVDSLLSRCASGYYRKTVVVSLLLITVEELFHLGTLQRYYISDGESWLKGLIFVLASWLLFQDGDIPRSPTSVDLASLAVLLAWVELLIMLSRLPNWGFGVLMFWRVAKNVLKMLVTFIFLLIGFTFAFMIQFNNHEPFSGWWLSIVKVMVMMSEFDYGAMFEERHGPDYMMRILFLMFLVLVSIVLMNLMVGVAVSDIAQLEAQGRVSRLAKQVDFLSFLEVLVYNDIILKIFPKSLRKAVKRRRAVPPVLKLKPGKPVKSNFRMLPFNLRNSILEKVNDYHKIDKSIDLKELNSKLDRLVECTCHKDGMHNVFGSRTSSATDKTEKLQDEIQKMVERLDRIKYELIYLKKKL